MSQPGPSPSPRLVRDGVLVAWSLALAVLLLGRALAPGYVLSYDMVWVPHLALRPDVWGATTALPRAVPSDALVALADHVVPGAVLQKLVLLGPLVAGGLGAARLLPTAYDGLVPRLVVVGLWQWNPFVVERLVLGQWTMLVAYGVLPWVILAARGWRTRGTVGDHPSSRSGPWPPTVLWWLVPLGSLSPSAGIATAVVLVLVGASRGRRRAWGLAALVVAGNAAWVAAALLHSAASTTEAAGASAFALHGEGGLPAPLAALTLGGVWNAEVVPGSRTGVLGWVATVVVLALVAVGARPGSDWWRGVVRRDRLALLASWALGWGLGVLTWLAPGPLGWADAHLPGVALLRDGGRLLLLCAPLLVSLAGCGAGQVWRWLQRREDLTRTASCVVAVALAVLPVALLPDAAWGSGGRLQAVHYPADYTRAAEAVQARVGAQEAAGRAAGDVLLLPLTSYRAPAWNGGRTVLDPLSRYLAPDVLSSDRLIVDGRVASGEDPRVAAAGRALALSTPALRAAALARSGVGTVVVETDAGATPTVAGTLVLRTPTLTVIGLTSVVPDRPPRWWYAVLAPAWVVFLGAPLLAAAVALLGGWSRRRSRRDEGDAARRGTAV